jgi:hypothetical protein
MPAPVRQIVRLAWRWLSGQSGVLKNMPWPIRQRKRSGAADQVDARQQEAPLPDAPFGTTA